MIVNAKAPYIGGERSKLAVGAFTIHLHIRYNRYR